jgi:hypothetical protein
VPLCKLKIENSAYEALRICMEGSKWDNKSYSRHRMKCLLDCFGGQLDANAKISTGYAQNVPDHWE